MEQYNIIIHVANNKYNLLINDTSFIDNINNYNFDMQFDNI